jgi:hypothetical protein
MEDEEMEDINEAIALSLRHESHESSGVAGQEDARTYSPGMLRNDNGDANAASSPDDGIEGMPSSMEMGSPPVSSTLTSAAGAGSSHQAHFTHESSQGALQPHLAVNFSKAGRTF